MSGSQGIGVLSALAISGGLAGFIYGLVHKRMATISSQDAARAWKQVALRDTMARQQAAGHETAARISAEQIQMLEDRCQENLREQRRLQAQIEQRDRMMVENQEATAKAAQTLLLAGVPGTDLRNLGLDYVDPNRLAALRLAKNPSPDMLDVEWKAALGMDAEGHAVVRRYIPVEELERFAKESPQIRALISGPARIAK